jgi:hypothetical protein
VTKAALPAIFLGVTATIPILSREFRSPAARFASIFARMLL